MINNEELNALLEQLIQPRKDYFSFEKIQALLPLVCTQVANIGKASWDSLELLALAEALSSGQLSLISQPGHGEKGIHGSNPIHGVLYQFIKKRDDIAQLNERLLLLAHIINAARQWRKDMQTAESSDNFFEQRDKRLKQTTYLKNLESACKVVRRIDDDWLFLLSPPNQSTEILYKRCDAFIGDNDKSQQEGYIKELALFFAYALNHRQPLRGYQETSPNELHKKPIAQRKRRFDDDPDESWRETANSAISLPPDIDEKTKDTLRTSGLCTVEESPATELIQNDAPIQAAAGDSSLQAVFRARSQQIFQDKAAQLLPGRWEQLSAFDLHQLMQQLEQKIPSLRPWLQCVVGLLLMTGRSLDSVLDTQVIKHIERIPKLITDQAIYVLPSEQACWVTGVFRPESSRQLTGEWPAHMRITKDRLTLPVPPMFWGLIKLKALHVASRVNKRSVPLFPKDYREELKNELKVLLSDINRKTGSRLTVHRLGAHLFNTLNHGDADLTASCLITARVPSFGQQASLYYYAPHIKRLEQQYIQAMEAIARQCSTHPSSEAEPSHAIACATSHSDAANHVGSNLVPRTAYVNALVTNMQQQIKEAKMGARSAALFSMHNAYVAYTVAMLMFSTGYRSVRDPLPSWNNISLSRRMIVIADKTDDQQSHARFLPLTSLMVEQLQHYQRHRQGLLGRLAFYLQHQWDTPFMFLDHYGNPKEVTPTRLHDQLHWIDAPPLNINRHYLHTQLKESHLSSEVVDAFMGHWDSGQEPWASYSTFCPREYQHLIASVIQPLMVKQGWKALKGAAL
ncbi:hypothetical protein HZU72_15160 [Halomonas sp. QX-2]|uniref:Uncharacterized protein n=1 Tax=Vreelandella sedimenti TaxID=2729618 RepID=A0A7Z0N8S9_9GAMM|nr:hypothetical protein [Halomonas sedimenti]NYT73755.1 hypothetical protein [Halomonas sedimenti]